MKEVQNKIDWEKFKFCPICNERAVLSCKCPRADSKCKNGHEWHICTVHGKVVLGRSDHSLATFTCTCK